jgi:hypothetical protein
VSDRTPSQPGSDSSRRDLDPMIRLDSEAPESGFSSADERDGSGGRAGMGWRDASASARGASRGPGQARARGTLLL